MMPSSPPTPNVATNRWRASPATQPLAAKCLAKRQTRFSPAGAAASQAIRWRKQLPKIGDEHAGGTGGGTIANAAIPESP
jgi:hypothetical protein